MDERSAEQAANFQVAQTVRHLNDEWVTAFVQRDLRKIFDYRRDAVALLLASEASRGRRRASGS